MENTLTNALAAVGESRAGDTKGKYLTFLTDGQLFGVPISDVVQIVGMQRITEIPDYPPYAKGVINLRGAIIPVIDVRLRLGKQQAEYSDRTCVIVSGIQDRFFGFIVDGVDEVTDVQEDRVSQPPAIGGDETSRYLTGVARLGSERSEKIVLLIDTAKILGDNELELLSQAI